MLIDRISGFAVLGIMGLYGLPTLVERLFGFPKSQTILGIVIVGVGLFAVFFVLVRLRVHIVRFRGGRFRSANCHRHVVPRRAAGDSTKIVLLSIGAQISAFVVVWLILHDLGADVSLVGVMIVAPVVLLSAGAADIDCGMGFA